MHPYRDSPVTVQASSRRDPDELILCAFLLVIGAIPVVIAIVHKEVFGFDATLGLLMMCGGILGLVIPPFRAWIRTHPPVDSGSRKR